MTSFISGPAAGQVLPLRRAPIMLRVVRSPNGVWDALDQIDDEPKPREAIFVYRLTKEPTYMHLCMRPRSGSGFYAMAEYGFLLDQPAEMHLRTSQAWRDWCDLNHDRLMPDWARRKAAEKGTVPG
jgi:hypothetical protein